MCINTEYLIFSSFFAGTESKGEVELPHCSNIFALFSRDLLAVTGGALKCQIYYLKSQRRLVAF